MLRCWDAMMLIRKFSPPRIKRSEDDFEIKSKYHSFNNSFILYWQILSFQDEIILRNMFYFITKYSAQYWKCFTKYWVMLSGLDKLNPILRTVFSHFINNMTRLQGRQQHSFLHLRNQHEMTYQLVTVHIKKADERYFCLYCIITKYFYIYIH